MYGLSLVKASNGKLSRSSIYITLGRLEEQGFVRTIEDPSVGSSRLSRSQYKLTGLGQRVLAAAEIMEFGALTGLAHD
jgi:DNA-binding PadR family transcriptional regulator